MQHPNQSRDEMEALQNIYDKIKNEKHAATIFTGDYNCRSSLFWENDIENCVGRIFNNFLLSNNLVKLINEPTHIRDDGTQTCIGLICTDQPIFIDTGVLPTLDPHSKHNIIHGTLNFNFPSPPRYTRKFWDYNSAKI